MASDEWLADAAATEALGARLAKQLKPGVVVYLRGDLGAGKTTLVRGLLRALGYSGPVKSPTYTIIESYPFADELIVHHLDLYRLADPEELEWIGIRDLMTDHAISLIEWPKQGAGILPPPDLTISLEPEGCGRRATLSLHEADS
jgi:tRNA threonylcarbamoyladenosine biosynthesis protein TsaE